MNYPASPLMTKNVSLCCVSTTSLSRDHRYIVPQAVFSHHGIERARQRSAFIVFHKTRPRFKMYRFEIGGSHQARETSAVEEINVVRKAEMLEFIITQPRAAGESF